MSECKDCIQVKSIEDKIASIWHVIKEFKATDKDYEKRLTDLEIAKGEDRKDLERISKAIEEIKKSLDKIVTSIETIHSKPGKTFENLKYEIIKYIVIAILAVAIAKLT